MVTLETIATHEAGHAVMRWLRGLPATEITVTADGGFCAGTGKPIDPESCLLVTLAGFAVETGYGLVTVDLTLPEAAAGDFDVARDLLRRESCLRLYDRQVQDVEAALRRYFARAEELLDPYADLVDAIGRRLEDDGRVSARTVAALCREYEKKMRRLWSEEDQGETQ